MDYPKEVTVLAAATAINCSVGTIYNLVGHKKRRGKTHVSFDHLCQAVKANPEFLADCLAGRDRAVGLAEAATAFGLSSPQLGRTARRRKIAQPAAMLKKGWRYSARELGLIPIQS